MLLCGCMDRGGTLQRSRTPRNGDVREDGLNEKRVVMTRKIGMICKGKMVLIGSKEESALAAFKACSVFAA